MRCFTAAMNKPLLLARYRVPLSTPAMTSLAERCELLFVDGCVLDHPRLSDAWGLWTWGERLDDELVRT